MGGVVGKEGLPSVEMVVREAPVEMVRMEAQRPGGMPGMGGVEGRVAAQQKEQVG